MFLVISARWSFWNSRRAFIRISYKIRSWLSNLISSSRHIKASWIFASRVASYRSLITYYKRYGPHYNCGMSLSGPITGGQPLNLLYMVMEQFPLYLKLGQRLPQGSAQPLSVSYYVVGLNWTARMRAYNIVCRNHVFIIKIGKIHCLVIRRFTCTANSIILASIITQWFNAIQVLNWD